MTVLRFISFETVFQIFSINIVREVKLAQIGDKAANDCSIRYDFGVNSINLHLFSRFKALELAFSFLGHENDN